MTAPPTVPHPAADPHLAAARRRLLWRIHRRYQTLTETIRVGPLELPFTRIEDPDRVLDQVAAEEDRRDRLAGRRRDGDQLHLPYWAELWDSALGVAQFLLRHKGVRNLLPERPEGCEGGQEPFAASGPGGVLRTNGSCPLPDRSVLDLGCGMGFAGTVAAALGHRVLFADLETPALLFAALNSLPWRPRVRTRRTNWRSDDLRERFDLIIGADILYERAQWDYLDPFWRKHLAPGGQILLGEPGRQTGDAFIAWIASCGWHLTQHEEPVPTRSRPIRLFELR